MAVGVRRTTFSDVARRAGVSRMTLYRRFPDLEAVLSALMTREFGVLVQQARDAGHASGATCRDRAVTMVDREAEPVLAALDVPALAPDAAVGLRLRLAELRRLM